MSQTPHLVAVPRLEPESCEALHPCPWCGLRADVIWVTSHVQCSACGQVIESCCEGPSAAA